jgi:predicted DNA-binding transcriptional regulator YafY
MNRTDRLLAIILELQSRRSCRAEDLAATFEISRRTVYRDIEALAEAGVPIIATPGIGYSLVEGYFLPPVRFTVEEAIMLLLGSTMMTQAFDTEYQRASTVAAHKIEALLSDADRARVAELSARIQFIVPTTSDRSDEKDAIPKLRRAILDSQVVRFTYLSRHMAYKDVNSSEVRDVRPYNLVNVNGNWQLVGYCLLRQDIRVFRFSRMADLKILGQKFDRKEHLELWERAQRRMSQPTYPFTAVLEFDPESARWAQEDQFFYISDRQEVGDRLQVRLNAPDEQAVLQWILGWGKHVRVLEPESLRQRLIAELQAALNQLEQT